MKIRKIAVAACTLAAVAAPLAGSPALAEDAGSATPLTVTVSPAVSYGSPVMITGTTSPSTTVTIATTEHSRATYVWRVRSDASGAFSAGTIATFSGHVRVDVGSGAAAAHAVKSFEVAGVLKAAMAGSGAAIRDDVYYEPWRVQQISVWLQYRDIGGWHYASAAPAVLPTTSTGSLTVTTADLPAPVTPGVTYRLVVQAAGRDSLNAPSNKMYQLPWTAASDPKP